MTNNPKILLAGDIAPVLRSDGRCSIRNTCTDASYKINKKISNFMMSNFSIGNLETTITDSDDKYPNKLNYKTSPSIADTILPLFKYVNIANNHIYDYRQEGLNDTINYLEKNNILFTGASNKSMEDAEKYIIADYEGFKIAIFSATDYNPYDKYDQNNFYLSYIKIGDIDKIKKIINEIKIKKPNFIIFSYHFGSNYKKTIDPTTLQFFNNILSQGVHIIHGHSAHHLNKCFFYKNILGKYIIYSNGEFINDYGWGDNKKDIYLMDHSAIFSFDMNTRTMKYIPTIIRYELPPEPSSSDSKKYYAIKTATLEIADGNEKKKIKKIINDNNFRNGENFYFLKK